MSELGSDASGASSARAKAVDVAARAGVSIATVSLVANGKARGRVSPDTQRRVQQAIEELGYVVNHAARSLVTGRWQCIALLAHNMTNPFTSLMASGVAEVLPADTQLLLALSGSNGESPDIGRVAAFGVDGILINFPSAGQLQQLPHDTPVVHLDDPTANSDLSRVYFDLPTGAGQLARHLTDLGHRHVVYLDSTRPWPTFVRRRQAFVDELTRSSRDIRLTRVRCDIDIDAGRALAERSWARWSADGVTAVVTSSDVQALGVLAALGDRVPDEVSVASFDDVPFSAIASPPLTAVSLSAVDLGRHASLLLIDLIERGPRAARTTVLPTTLVERDSTGPAPRPDKAA